MSKLVVTALGVGHGDATLVEWFSDQPTGKTRFTCLVDGGESPRILKDALERRGVSRLDLLVVSHFDADHIGGLRDITAVCPVDSYWGPCLPAFDRHFWLFGERIREGIERARDLEQALSNSGATINYVLEGFASSREDNAGPVLRILSPPAKIVRTLLVSEDIEWLFSHSPTPLGWLAEPDAPVIEQPANLDALDEHLRTGALSPEDLRWIQRRQVKADTAGLRREWGARYKMDPEFFGDSVLNNTSIILWIDAPGQARRHRVLLTGDQENWTYLLLRHPFGLQADVLKAPHHGGSLYIESDSSHEEVFSAVRPAVVLFSANGRYGLPHTQTRASAIRWGSTICCTSNRRLEFIAGSGEQDACCHSAYGCEGSQDTSITLDKNGIRADSPACHSGYGTVPGPVIQLRQHQIDGSPIMQRLFEQELRKHIEWTRKRLRALHEERSAASEPGMTGSEVVSYDHLAALAREAGRHGLAFHLDTVIAQGWERKRFWSTHRRSWSGDKGAYALPTEAEIEQFIAALRNKALLLFLVEDYGAAKLNFTDRATAINGLDRSELARFADASLHFPAAMFEEAFWPWVQAEIARWHCYRHRSGAIGLSRLRSPTQLCSHLFQHAFEKTSTWDHRTNTSVPYYRVQEPGWSSQILVTKHSKNYKSWDQYWFIAGPYSNEGLAQVSINDLAAAAEKLAPLIERIW